MRTTPSLLESVINDSGLINDFYGVKDGMQKNRKNSIINKS